MPTSYESSNVIRYARWNECIVLGLGLIIPHPSRSSTRVSQNVHQSPHTHHLRGMYGAASLELLQSCATARGRKHVCQHVTLICTCTWLQLEGMAGGSKADAVGTGAGAKPKAARALSDTCRVLADIAEPPNMKQAFDASLSVVLLQVRAGLCQLCSMWYGYGLRSKAAACQTRAACVHHACGTLYAAHTVVWA